MSDEPIIPTTSSADTATLAPTPKPVPKKKPGSSGGYTWGLGRRKRAVARVRIRPGDGKFQINKRPIENFFALDHDRKAVRVPQNITETAETLDVFVNVRGGGVTGQAGAVVLGIARALIRFNPDLEPKLREQDLLSRDPRKVERKKYGQRGARRRFQFSKR